MLTRHREKWVRYKRRGNKQARKELICEFLPLVHYVYSRMSLYLPRILDEQDLVAAGTIGLISAVNDFDISRGIEFSTFAVPRIRGAMLDELREHDWIPRTARRKAMELDEALKQSQDTDMGAPDLGQTARLLGLSRTQLSKLMAKVQPAAFVSLEHPHDHADETKGMNVSQLLADTHSEDPQGRAELIDQCSALQAALTMLPEAERSVITQYYFEQRMQKDIARGLRVSRSRVSQIHNRAINTLRERMSTSGAA